jgi:hypothetical protein
MIEIKGLVPGSALPPEDLDRERLKEIKSRVGKVAFAQLFGNKAKVAHVSNGISRSESALKWIEAVFNKEKWKDS